MKKMKELNDANYSNILAVGSKILSLTYILLILLLVIAVLYIGRETSFFSVVGSIFDIIMPLFVGFVLAWLLSPAVEKLEEKGISRVFGTLIVYAILIAVLFGFVSMFIPVIFGQIADFISILPSVIASLMETLEPLFTRLSEGGMDVAGLQETVTTNMQDFSNGLISNLPKDAMNIATNLFSGIFDLIFSLILGIYILMDFDDIKKNAIKFTPKKHQGEAGVLMAEVGNIARKSVNGILLIASMIFVVNTVGFTILGLEAALLLGLFCGITNLIPYIGPWIGGGAAVIVGFSQSVTIGIGVCVIALVSQLLESYILQPIVMSKVTNIHPIIIMLSLLLMGYFFGIIGMVVATPLLSICKVFFMHFDKKYDFFGLHHVEKPKKV